LHAEGASLEAKLLLRSDVVRSVTSGDKISHHSTMERELWHPA
jgi:hypothetical protein